MRKRLVFHFFILISGITGLYAQTGVPKHYELKGQAYTQADSILDVWMDTQYPVILKKNKLKMNCAKCTSIFMDIVMQIDYDGRILEGDVVKTVKCGSDKFSEDLYYDFVIFFENLIFPPSLRGLVFQYRLGTSLKC